MKLALGLLCLTGCVEMIVAHTRPPPPPSPPEETAVRAVVIAQQQPPPPAPAASPQGVVALALGENHSCALSAAGQVRCWGYNKQGSLGVGSPLDPADGMVAGIDEPVRAIAAGGYQTCALTPSARVWCWGANHAGQVGTGRVSEAPVTRPTRIGALPRVRSLHVGDATTCAIAEDGEVYCWGQSTQGTIDDSGRREVPSPTRVPGLRGSEALAVGNHHLCAARGGRVECRGQLAPLNPQLSGLTRVTALSAGWGHSCALIDGRATCWGENYLGVLGIGPTQGHQLLGPTPVGGIEGAVQITGLDYHTCVRFSNGGVTCWGNNQGHAFSDALPAEPAQFPHALEGIAADVVYVGGVHVCVLRAGVPRCRGNDWSGAVRGAR